MHVRYEVKYCEEHTCGGAALCSEGTCEATGDIIEVFRTSWVSTGVQCPGGIE